MRFFSVNMKPHLFILVQCINIRIPLTSFKRAYKRFHVHIWDIFNPKQHNQMQLYSCHFLSTCSAENALRQLPTLPVFTIIFFLKKEQQMAITLLACRMRWLFTWMFIKVCLFIWNCRDVDVAFLVYIRTNRI